MSKPHTLYQILQWTPFPNRYQPMPEWQLQTAEFGLNLNKTYYYETADRTASSIRYPLEVAIRIVAYWEARWPFADYQLRPSVVTHCGHPGSTNDQ